MITAKEYNYIILQLRIKPTINKPD